MRANEIQTWLRRWTELGHSEDDSLDLRLKKAVMTLVSTSIAVLAVFWGSLYLYSGYPLSGAIPLGYALISFSSILHFFKTKRFAFFCFSQQLLILVLPFLLMWSLGGFANGSVVMIWAFFAPLAALYFIDLRAASRWLLAFLMLLLISALIDHQLAAHVRSMPPTLNTLFFLMNTGCGFTLVALTLYYFVKDRESAYEQLRQRENHIRELMLTDTLTAVANRRHLDDRLKIELARLHRYGQPLAVIMTDIDWFKQVNDNHGHAVGDKVLKAFAASLQQNIRTTDFLARYGGEEFVILLPNTGFDEAIALAERMRKAIKALRFEGYEFTITASFGVVLCGPHETPETIISRVDAAMYKSKTLGRDRVTAFDS